MKLIDVDDIHFVWNGVRKNGKTVFAETFNKFFNEIIQKAPTVDAVPVIRCKDCKNYGTSDCAMFLEKGENGCKEDYMWNEPTDFCSWAERREIG